jgi:hypothetical protein
MRGHQLSEERGMKGTGLFLLVAAMVFAAAGCGEDEVATTSNDPLYPDVVTTYHAPSNDADNIGFEEVTAQLGTVKKIQGYIRNVGSETSETFEVHFKLSAGDIAVQDDTTASLTANILDPGMRTSFEGSLSPGTFTQVTLTYWGTDGPRTTQEFTLSVQ